MWTPQPRQLKLLASKHIPVVLFGGARGGGKTDSLLGDFLQDVDEGRSWSGLYIRQTYPELLDVIARALEIYEPTGAKYLKGDRTFFWPSGASLTFRAIETDDDARKIQGYGRAWIAIDEAGFYVTDYILRVCLAANRGHPLSRVRLSANPGGPGHSWLKSLFLDIGNANEPIIDADILRMFIPSRVQDNTALLERDPRYIERLQALGSPELVRAWLEGDWDVTLGAYFPEFSRARHVIDPFTIPQHWVRFRAIDWGMSHPAACLWFAVSEEGELIIYREYYAGNDSDKGLGLTAEEFAREVIALEADDEAIAYSVADPSCLSQRGPIVRGPSISEQWSTQGLYCRGADNDRLAGWSQMRQRMRSDSIKLFSSCRHLIRTLPLLQHDKRRMEDLDTTGPDHLADAMRYGCMSRPYVQHLKTQEEPRHLVVHGKSTATMNDLWKDFEREQNAWR